MIKQSFLGWFLLGVVLGVLLGIWLVTRTPQPPTTDANAKYSDWRDEYRREGSERKQA